MKLRTLLIFAHPDDELLWMGGFLLHYKDQLKIDFLCLTSPFNVERIKGLTRLDATFDTGCVLCLGYEDNPAVYREGASFDFYDGWIDAVDFDKYDLVFSHNEKGEYGHPHHKYIHRALKEAGIDFISFGRGEYKKDRGEPYEDDYDFYLELSDDEIKIKQELLFENYPGESTRCLSVHSYWDTKMERFSFTGDGERFKVLKDLECDRLKFR